MRNHLGEGDRDVSLVDWRCIEFPGVARTLVDHTDDQEDREENDNYCAMVEHGNNQ